jgi:hypothetical protein
MITPRERIMSEMAAVAALHRVTLKEVLSPSRRRRDLGPARRAVARFLFLDRDLKVTHVARLMRKDHTTIYYYLGMRGSGHARAR